MIILINSFNMNISGLSNIEFSLHSYNKLNLVMIYYLLKVLVDCSQIYC